MTKRVLYSLLAVSLALPLTYFLGGLTVPKSVLKPLVSESGTETTSDKNKSSSMLHVAIEWGSPSSEALEEIISALEHGIRSIVLPWPDHSQMDEMESLVNSLNNQYSDVTWFFDLSLSPPSLWFDANPTSKLENDVEDMASILSPEWLNYGKEKIDQVIRWQEKQSGTKVGLILTHLYQGNWYLNDHVDNSEDFERLFVDWLEREHPKTLENEEILWDELHLSPSLHPLYTQFYNQKTVDVLKELISYPRSQHEWGGEIFLPIGFSLNSVAMENGHRYWPQLLKSTITGFIFPIRKDMSGLGKKGLAEGLADLAQSSQKKVIYWDQISTGLGSTSALHTSLSSDHWDRISHMLGRGIGSAALNNGIYCISDASGTGTYNDPRFWVEFSKNDLQVDSQVETVKVDILILTSMEHSDTPLLNSIKDAFSHSGLQFTFFYLENMSSGEIPPAHIVYFLDGDSTNDELFSLLKRKILKEGSALVHYVSNIPDDISIFSNLTEAKILFHATADQSLMPFSYAGEYIGENFELEWLSEKGTGIAFSSTDFDPLIKTNHESQFSAGIHFDGEGGAYILLTQPITDPRLFLEIRELLELDAFRYSAKNNIEHLVLKKRNSILLYGAGKDKIKLEFPSPRTVINVFDPNIGWVDTYSIELDIEEGRLIWLTFQ
jgi:hypothetical protein